MHARSFVLAVVVAGCSGGDPSTLTLGHGQWGGGGGSAGAGASGGDGGSTSSADAGATQRGGVDGGADSSATPDAATAVGRDASTPTNAFTGAPAFTAGQAGTDAQGHHAFSLAGHDCAACHGGASPSSGIRFDWAGRVFADANGQTPGVGVEIRVVDHNGAAASAYSDSLGYFYHPAAVDLAIPAMAGARTAGATKTMIGALSDPNKRGGCNGCHDGTTTAYLNVP